MLRQLAVGPLPGRALEAASVLMTRHLPAARALLADPDCTALVIVLPPAPQDHADWRRALARDLAREAAPKRVNVVAANPGAARAATIGFLTDAPGVTGQYLVCHDDDRDIAPPA